MDADALKIGNTLHQRKPLLEPWRFRDNNRIRALRYRRMTRYLAGFLTRYPAVPSILLFRFQFDTQKVSPRRLQGITEVMLLVQLRLIEAMFKDTLVAYFYPPNAKYVSHPYRSGYKDDLSYKSSSLLFFLLLFPYAMNSPFGI